jgi:hypothetical protein
MSFDATLIGAKKDPHSDISLLIHKPSHSRVLATALQNATAVLKLKLESRVGAAATRDAITAMFEARDRLPGLRFASLQLVSADAVVVDPKVALKWGGPDGLKAQLMDKLSMDTASSQLIELRADAKLAKDVKNPFQHALLVCTLEVNDFVAGMVMASSMCLPGEVTRGQEFPRDFPERVLNFNVRFWSEKSPNEIGNITLENFVMTAANKRRSLFLISEGGGGKNELTKSLGRVYCRRTGLSQYMFGKSIDPIGILTKHNEVTNKAMLGLADFEMTVLMNTPLTMREKLNLLSMDEKCETRGRYHQVIVPMGMRKVFSANFGVNPDGSDDPGGFFEEHGLYGVAALARGDLKALLSCPAGGLDRAAARRVAVLVTHEDFGIDVQALEDAGEAEHAEELAREAAYWADRGE